MIVATQKLLPVYFKANRFTLLLPICIMLPCIHVIIALALINKQLLRIGLPVWNRVIYLATIKNVPPVSLYTSVFDIFVYNVKRWGKRAAHNRAQIVYYIAENLELRHDEVAQRISAMTGRSIKDAKQEVDLAVQRLFHWGAYADKYGGTIQVCKNCVRDSHCMIV